MDFKKESQVLKQSINNLKFNGLNQIRYYNFWNTQLAREIWFTRFIEHYKLLNNHKGKVNFYSVLGTLEVLEKHKSGINIFFSGENMQADRFSEYKQVCETKQFDLSLGFDNLDKDDYLRFPLWIVSLFDPIADYEAVKLRVKQLSQRINQNRTGFCALVASHDWNGIRGQMMDRLSEIDTVASGGNFRKNTDDLNQRFGNNKYEFLTQYKFNICPENSNSPGYVTEKIFQAFEAGCIPIYWGSDNKPEVDILNQSAIVFWNQLSDNQKVVDHIKCLYQNSAYYDDFIDQPIFLSNAEDMIWDFYEKLLAKLKMLF